MVGHFDGFRHDQSLKRDSLADEIAEWILN
jgi:hypothetical protein